MRVSVVIPTLNAAGEIGSLLERLLAQTIKPNEVLIIDSDSEDDTVEIVSSFPGITMLPIDRREFDHGATRHRGVLETTGDYVLFLTQDALPANYDYIESLIRPLEEDPFVAMVTGRQLPKADARRFEQLVREFNYPARSVVKSKSSIAEMGVKAYYASDVCSAYRRSDYFAQGGFLRPCETNEDMFMAAKFINAGKKVAYAAEAQVFHSHNLSLREQYLRNRLLGRVLEENRSLICCESEVGEGVVLARSVLSQLIAEHRLCEALSFVADCAARLIGNRVGRREGFKRIRVTS